MHPAFPLPWETDPPVPSPRYGCPGPKSPRKCFCGRPPSLPSPVRNLPLSFPGTSCPEPRPEHLCSCTLPREAQLGLSALHRRTAVGFRPWLSSWPLVITSTSHLPRPCHLPATGAPLWAVVLGWLWSSLMTPTRLIQKAGLEMSYVTFMCLFGLISVLSCNKADGKGHRLPRSPLGGQALVAQCKRSAGSAASFVFSCTSSRHLFLSQTLITRQMVFLHYLI